MDAAGKGRDRFGKNSSLERALRTSVEVLELSPSDGSSGLGGVEMLVMDEMPGWIFDDAEGILTKVKSKMRFGLECIVRSSPANQASMTCMYLTPTTLSV